MDNSIYIALSRELALFRDMDVTASNIANANTVGYGAEHILFDSYLTKDINNGEPNKMAFANDIATYRKIEGGPMNVTGNPLDLAISGEGYFMVETPLGTRYTRAGNFQIAGDGTLSTADGYPVLDASGQRITFPDDTTLIEVGEVGNLKVNSEDFATIGVVRFENEQLLERLGNNLLASDATPQPAEETARVIQGSLEGSNVQPVTELTRMIAISRAVANNARFIETMYDMQRKAANVWARQG